MCHEQDYDEMLINFRDEIESENFLEEFKDAMTKSIDEIIDYYLNFPLFKRRFEIKAIPAPKCPTVANMFRSEGNSLFKGGSYYEALKSYNDSIVFSSFGANDSLASIPDNTLALAYSNRSSTAFELGLYQDCLNDIERAIEHGHPLRLRSKLVGRQAKCFLALGMKREASIVLEGCIEGLKMLSLNDTKNRGNIENLEDLKGSFKTGSSDKIEYKKHWLGKFCLVPEVEIPVIEDEHPQIPNLSSAADLVFSEERGRHLVATRDIEPGELIIVDKSFCATVNEASDRTHCTYCIKRTFFPIPCRDCTSVVFCSEKCRTLAWDEFHQIECKFIATLNQYELNHALLPVRLLIKVGLKNLKKNVPTYLKEAANNVDPAKLGFDKNSIYLSENYRTIFNMTTNIGKIDHDSLLAAAATCYSLLKFLEDTSFFPRHIKNSDRKLVYKVLFIHYLILTCNFQTFKELKIEVEDEKCEGPGIGISSLSSLVRGSCDPTIGKFYCGSTILIRSFKYIPTGAEITESYGRCFTGCSYEERQTYIRDQYKYKCECRACEEKWPLFWELSDELRTHCTTCKQPIECKSSDDDLFDKNICSNCTKGFVPGTKRYKQMMKKNGENTSILKTISANLARCSSMQDRLGDIWDHELALIKETITLICKHAVLPSKGLYELISLLSNIWDRQGSHYYLPKLKFILTVPECEISDLEHYPLAEVDLQ